MLLIALGLSIREHHRPDRDSFIVFDWDNMTPQAARKCAIAAPPMQAAEGAMRAYMFTERYNYESLLHLPAMDPTGGRLAKDPTKPLLRPLEHGVVLEHIGQKSNFTEGDFERLRLLYRCPSKS